MSFFLHSSLIVAHDILRIMSDKEETHLIMFLFKSLLACLLLIHSNFDARVSAINMNNYCNLTTKAKKFFSPNKSYRQNFWQKVCHKQRDGFKIEMVQQLKVNKEKTKLLLKF